VAVDPDERDGGDGARKSNSVSNGFPPGMERCLETREPKNNDCRKNNSNVR